MAAKKKLKLNIPLLRKIKKTILDVPERYNQSEVVDFGAPGEKSVWEKQTFPACGTVACIGGWAYVLAKNPPKKRPQDLGALLKSATALLGLNEDQTDILFCGDGDVWPSKFRNLFKKRKSLAGKAKVAAGLLDEVIRTKGQILTDTYNTEYGIGDVDFPDDENSLDY